MDSQKEKLDEQNADINELNDEAIKLISELDQIKNREKWITKLHDDIYNKYESLQEQIIQLKKQTKDQDNVVY